MSGLAPEDEPLKLPSPAYLATRLQRPGLSCFEDSEQAAAACFRLTVHRAVPRHQTVTLAVGVPLYLGDTRTVTVTRPAGAGSVAVTEPPEAAKPPTGAALP